MVPPPGVRLSQQGRERRAVSRGNGGEQSSRPCGCTEDEVGKEAHEADPVERCHLRVFDRPELNDDVPELGAGEERRRGAVATREPREELGRHSELAEGQGEGEGAVAGQRDDQVLVEDLQAVRRVCW